MNNLTELQLIKRYRLVMELKDLAGISAFAVLAFLASPGVMFGLAYLFDKNALINAKMENTPLTVHEWHATTHIFVYIMGWFSALLIALVVLDLVALIMYMLIKRYHKLIAISIGSQCIRKEFVDEYGVYVIVILKTDSPWRDFIIHKDGTYPFYLKRFNNDNKGVSIEPLGMLSPKEKRIEF